LKTENKEDWMRLVDEAWQPAPKRIEKMQQNQLKLVNDYFKDVVSASLCGT